MVEITLVREKENSEKSESNYLEEKRSVFENEVIDEVFRDSVERQMSVNQGRKPKESKLECELDRNSYVVKLRGIGISLIDFQPIELCYVSIDGISVISKVHMVRRGDHMIE